MSRDPHGNVHGNCQTTIGSLRAEVERLRRGTDEDGLSLSERCCGQVKELLKRERAEALLQAAENLLRASALGVLDQTSTISALSDAIADLPTKARALLDRLQLLEQFKTEHEKCVQEMQADALAVAERENEIFSEKDARLQRAEAVVEAANRVVAESCPDISPSMGAVHKLAQALAAWEEGT